MIGVTLYGAAADPLVHEIVRAIKDRVPLCPNCGWPEDRNHTDVMSLSYCHPRALLLSPPSAGRHGVLMVGNP
jgi:hypothetical protein